MVKAGQLRQVTLMTIMNIGVDIILKTLSISFRMVTKILKEHKGVHTKVQGQTRAPFRYFSRELLPSHDNSTEFLQEYRKIMVGALFLVGTISGP